MSADRLVLRDAIANVVDNAIKYGPSRSTIDVRVDADGDQATLTVTDEGPGIPAEHRERIFDRFYRIDEGRSRDSGGTGLGLAIAKWAVEANGGRISLEGCRHGIGVSDHAAAHRRVDAVTRFSRRCRRECSMQMSLFVAVLALALQAARLPTRSWSSSASTARRKA